ncbi:MAG: YesL family protein [Bacillota bacterium]
MATTIMEGITRVLEWIMRFSVINLLWILFCLPIVIVTIPVFYADNVSAIFTLLSVIAILTPIFFFPATTAMFGVVRKWIFGEADVPLFKTYWKQYKENYVKSLLSGIIITIMWVILGIDVYYFTQVNPFISGFFIIGSFFLFNFTIFYFANTVHTELKLIAILKNSLILTFINPVSNLCLLIINVTILYICFQVMTAFIPFFMGTMIAFVSLKGYQQKILKVQGLKEQ